MEYSALLSVCVYIDICLSLPLALPFPFPFSLKYLAFSYPSLPLIYSLCSLLPSIPSSSFLHSSPFFHFFPFLSPSLSLSPSIPFTSSFYPSFLSSIFHTHPLSIPLHSPIHSFLPSYFPLPPPIHPSLPSSLPPSPIFFSALISLFPPTPATPTRTLFAPENIHLYVNRRFPFSVLLYPGVRCPRQRYLTAHWTKSFCWVPGVFIMSGMEGSTLFFRGKGGGGCVSADLCAVWVVLICVICFTFDIGFCALFFFFLFFLNGLLSFLPPYAVTVLPTSTIILLYASLKTLPHLVSLACLYSSTFDTIVTVT